MQISRYDSLTHSTQTSLLSAIVGEMVRVDGEVTLSGCVSYAPQNPWYVPDLCQIPPTDDGAGS